MPAEHSCHSLQHRAAAAVQLLVPLADNWLGFQSAGKSSNSRSTCLLVPVNYDGSPDSLYR